MINERLGCDYPFPQGASHRPSFIVPGSAVTQRASLVWPALFIDRSLSALD